MSVTSWARASQIQLGFSPIRGFTSASQSHVNRDLTNPARWVPRACPFETVSSLNCWSLQYLEQPRCAHPTAYTHGHHDVLHTASLVLEERLTHKASAAHSKTDSERHPRIGGPSSVVS